MRALLIAIALLASVVTMSCTQSETEGETSAQPQAVGPGGPTSADPAALAAADSAVQAIGGWEAWNQARYIAFDFVIERDGKEMRRTRHEWDRFSGDCRITGTNREGINYEVIMNQNSEEGTVLLDGEEASEESKTQLLKFVHGAFINDSYWLLMPYKMHDPGVHLTDEGSRIDGDGKEWRVVGLSFEPGIGMTSKDRYWVFLDPESYRVGRWEYHLEGMEEEDEPGMATWNDWTQVGPLMLSLEKFSEKSGATLRFENVIVTQTVPEGMFDA
jgi:hypothetical protein